MFQDPQVNFYVANVEECVRFYTEQLGFVESFRTPAAGEPDHVELRLGGLILGLASLAAARAMHDIPAETSFRQAEVCLWTDDVDAAYVRLLANGAGAMTPPHDFLGRLRAAWVIDPAGGPIQIVTRLPQDEA